MDQKKKQENNQSDPESVKHLDLSNKGIESTESLSLRKFEGLQKLNLSQNNLCMLKKIGHNKELTWLNLANNSITEFPVLKHLTKLSVVNVSHNSLTSVKSFNCLHGLKALILNGNKIKTFDELDGLKELNSLVLSHNNLETIDTSHFPLLAKLSLSHNKLDVFPNLQHNPKLKEIRMNDNRITQVPKSIEYCKYLQLIDLGNNKIASISDIKIIKSLKFLINLNLKGNLLENDQIYLEKVKDLCLALKVINGQKIRKPTDASSTKGSLKRDNSSGCPTRQESICETQMHSKAMNIDHREPAHSDLIKEKSKRPRTKDIKKEKRKLCLEEQLPFVSDTERPRGNSKDHKTVRSKLNDLPFDPVYMGDELTSATQIHTVSISGDVSLEENNDMNEKRENLQTLPSPKKIDVPGGTTKKVVLSTNKNSQKQLSVHEKRRKVETKITIKSADGISGNKSSTKQPSFKQHKKKSRKEKFDPRTGVVTIKKTNSAKKHKTTESTDPFAQSNQFNFGTGMASLWNT